ncbi:MAG: phosphodiester glycosidase family protein [Candidatus Levybacteria bacterium]|nr:phosphodiester glycosidase family protein [Candidatus Levybacteria bacterium]
MKKWIFILVTVIFIVLIISLTFDKKTPPQPMKTTSTTPSLTVRKQSITINSEGTPLQVSWAAALPPQVSLYTNLTDKKISNEIMAEKNCKILINGGFYSTTNTHLGLIVSNFETISPLIQSSLFNGFLWIDSAGAKISAASPQNTVRLALQSGPLIMLNNQKLPLEIRNDKPARRMIAAIDNNGLLVFIAIYNEKSKLQGPLLGQLPNIIESFKKKARINIVDAINLDGGSASAFIAGDESIRELAQIGSYFCIIN